jgi:hypothetical protein
LPESSAGVAGGSTPVDTTQAGAPGRACCAWHT